MSFRVLGLLPLPASGTRFLVRPELCTQIGTWFNRLMVIPILLFFSVTVSGLAAMRLFVEFRRDRLEARMSRAIRVAFIQ